MSMVIHKNFADFVLFLYIHMAHVDGEYHISEEEAILDKMQKLYPNEANPKQKLKDALDAYHQFDKNNFTALLHDTFFHFHHVKFAQKYKVYTDMFDIVHADGKLHEAEERALKELKRIIDMGAEAAHEPHKE